MAETKAPHLERILEENILGDLAIIFQFMAYLLNIQNNLIRGSHLYIFLHLGDGLLLFLGY